MRCSECGALLEKGNNICRNCGHVNSNVSWAGKEKLNDDNSTSSRGGDQEQQNSITSTSQMAPIKDKESFVKKAIKCLIIALISFLFSLLVFFRFGVFVFIILALSLLCISVSIIIGKILQKLLFPVEKNITSRITIFVNILAAFYIVLLTKEEVCLISTVERWEYGLLINIGLILIILLNVIFLIIIEIITKIKPEFNK